MDIDKIGSRVCILGLGKSAYESALYLVRTGFDVFLSEQQDSFDICESAKELQRIGVEVEIGMHSVDKILDRDWILVSPGISPQNQIIGKIVERGLPLFSEIEVASWFCKSKQIVAVTGSCGKTTVVSLLALSLQALGYKVHCCGNIGNPWIASLEDIQEDDWVVLELSSFQLYHSPSFHPRYGVILNIYPNHLDWHPTFENYVESKAKMLQNQASDEFALVREKDNQRYFSKMNIRSQIICYDKEPGQQPNHQVVHALCRYISPQYHSESVNQVIHQFKGIEHRLEFVSTVHKVNFINDSKSTTPASLAWALGKYFDHQVILIAGGHPKSHDFDTLAELVEAKTKKVYLIGEGKSLIRESWGNHALMEDSEDLRAAVRSAFQAASPGDVILLSPACASFDMFQDYRQRGKVFKDAVRSLELELTSRRA